MSEIELSDLHDEARGYVGAVGSEIKLDQSEYIIEGDEASYSDLTQAADFLMNYYDNLLSVDSKEAREDFQESIVYDPTFAENMSPDIDLSTSFLYLTGGVSGLGVSALFPKFTGGCVLGGLALGQYHQFKLSKNRSDGSYDRFSGDIGVSEDRVPKMDAIDTLSAELYHAFQTEFNSPTWKRSYMDVLDSETRMVREGTERAVRIKALEHLSEQNFMNQEWEELHNKRAASTLVNGYLQNLSQNKEVVVEDATNLGLSEDLAYQAVDQVGSRNSRQYNQVASAIIAAENVLGQDIYEEVFHGDVDPLEIL